MFSMKVKNNFQCIDADAFGQFAVEIAGVDHWFTDLRTDLTRTSWDSLSVPTPRVIDITGEGLLALDFNIPLAGATPGQAFQITLSAANPIAFAISVAGFYNSKDLGFNYLFGSVTIDEQMVDMLGGLPEFTEILVWFNLPGPLDLSYWYMPQMPIYKATTPGPMIQTPSFQSNGLLGYDLSFQPEEP